MQFQKAKPTLVIPFDGLLNNSVGFTRACGCWD